MSISTNLNCQFCNKAFYKPPCRIKAGRGKFCSRKCTDSYKKRFGLVKDQNNPSWKGGKTKTSHGYIWIRKLEHPFNMHGYVLEHRLKMEEYLGRYLTKDEVVHHIDGNKTNNFIGNLILMTRTNHSRQHMNFVL